MPEVQKVQEKIRCRGTGGAEGAGGKGDEGGAVKTAMLKVMMIGSGG